MTLADPSPAPSRTCQAIDVPSSVPPACWRTLRGWLEAMDVDFEPSLTPDAGLIGYAVRMRNYLVGIGLVMRSAGPALNLTAVLCRGMDREDSALAAVDRANRELALGQILYFPGPPAELSFYATVSFDLLDEPTFVLLFDAMLGELNNVGFRTVMQVRGYHPTDYAAPWGDPMMALIDEDDDLMATTVLPDRKSAAIAAAHAEPDEQPEREAEPAGAEPEPSQEDGAAPPRAPRRRGRGSGNGSTCN